MGHTEHSSPGGDLHLFYFTLLQSNATGGHALQYSVEEEYRDGKDESFIYLAFTSWRIAAFGSLTF